METSTHYLNVNKCSVTLHILLMCTVGTRQRAARAKFRATPEYDKLWTCVNVNTT